VAIKSSVFGAKEGLLAGVERERTAKPRCWDRKEEGKTGKLGSIRCNGGQRERLLGQGLKLLGQKGKLEDAYSRASRREMRKKEACPPGSSQWGRRARRS